MTQLTRDGRIVAIRDGRATIRVEVPPACTSCGSRGSCASGSAASTLVELPVSAGVRVGESVTLGLAEGSLARGALLAYLLPAVTMLLGAVSLAGSGDLAAMGGAMAGLGLGLIGLRVLGRRMVRHGESAVIVTTPPDTHSQPIGDSP